jgi:CBS domain containing-hemolysin-like protein
LARPPSPGPSRRDESTELILSRSSVLIAIGILASGFSAGAEIALASSRMSRLAPFRKQGIGGCSTQFRPGRRIVSSGHRWTVLEMDGLQVTKVRVQPETPSVPNLRQKSGQFTVLNMVVTARST